MVEPCKGWKQSIILMQKDAEIIIVHLEELEQLRQRALELLQSQILPQVMHIMAAVMDSLFVSLDVINEILQKCIPYLQGIV